MRVLQSSHLINCCILLNKQTLDTLFKKKIVPLQDLYNSRLYVIYSYRVEMKYKRFRQVVCILMALMVFISSVGFSFIKHHCTATNTTELFINESHDCSDSYSHTIVKSCSNDDKCSCASINLSNNDETSLKCEKCCKDSSRLFTLDIPINITSIAAAMEKVWIEVTLFSVYVSAAIIDFCVTLIKESPPLSNLLSNNSFIHFISVLLI